MLRTNTQPTRTLNNGNGTKSLIFNNNETHFLQKLVNNKINA